MGYLKDLTHSKHSIYDYANQAYEVKLVTNKNQNNIKSLVICGLVHCKN